MIWKPYVVHAIKVAVYSKYQLAAQCKVPNNHWSKNIITINLIDILVPIVPMATVV